MQIYKTIQFSIELKEKAINQLEFLEAINQLEPIFKGELIKKAIYRYEKLWLPFYASGLKALGFRANPPLDVEWIWHCHMLNPQQYFKDSMNLFGKILDHTNLTMKEIIAGQERIKPYWESRFQIAFDFLDSNSVDDNYANFTSQIEYDLYEASKRQLEFYYQVSLPHFKSDTYLDLAIERYKKFLHLKLENPTVFVVPCYSIDLIWHTHQLNPLAYSQDTIGLFGFLFDHDDSVVNRSEGEKLDVSGQKTMTRWRELYNEDFFLSGSAFRGNRPTNEFYSDSDPSFLYKAAKFELKKVRLSSNKNKEKEFVYKMHFVHITGQYDEEIKTNQELNDSLNGVVFFSTESVHFKLSLQLNEKLGSKLVNLVKTGHRHDSAHDHTFEFVLEYPKKTERIEERKFEFNFLSPKDDELVLQIEWNVSLFQNQMEFCIIKQKFEKINIMNEIKHNYENFSFETINFKNEDIVIKAEHRIQPWIYQSESFRIPLPEKENYICEILHIITMEWSSIRILKNSLLLASSKILNLRQLPSSNLNLSSLFITLNPQIERAMLITNLNGDYAIVKGRWIQNRRERGYLKVDWYSFLTKSFQHLEVRDSFEFKFTNETIQAIVNLKTGSINVKAIEGMQIKNLEIESLVAALVSIAVLYVSLQPKQVIPVRNQVDLKIRRPPAQVNRATAIGNKRPVRFQNTRPSPITSNYTMINIVGYNDMLPYYDECFNHHHHHHHHHHHDDCNCSNSNADNCGDGSNENDCQNEHDHNNHHFFNDFNSNNWFNNNDSINDNNWNDSGNTSGSSSCGGGGSSSCGGGGSSSCGGGGSSCGGGGGSSSCGGGGSSSCGGGGSSCGGGGSSCGGGGSSCGGG